jgi:hypothetical protein
LVAPAIVSSRSATSNFSSPSASFTSLRQRAKTPKHPGQNKFNFVCPFSLATTRYPVKAVIKVASPNLVQNERRKNMIIPIVILAILILHSCGH